MQTQPYPSDRDAGRARGCPSVTREAGTAGRRGAEPPSPQSPQTLQAAGALPEGGDALQDGPPTGLRVGEPDPRGRRRRRHRYGPLRPVHQEDAQGYMLMLRKTIEHHGVPLALYSDRHGIFQRSPKEPESLAEQLRGRRGSAGPWRSWTSGSSWPIRPRPRAV